LSAFETFVNVVFKFVPTVFTTAIIATAMPAAIKPYSIAVAPDSSRTNRVMIAFIDVTLCWLFELVFRNGQTSFVG